MGETRIHVHWIKQGVYMRGGPIGIRRDLWDFPKNKKYSYYQRLYISQVASFIKYEK